jgi:D-alanine-D-alanine ligase
MKVGLTYDLRTDWVLRPEDPVDANAEFDKPETIETIAATIESAGHQVVRIGNVFRLWERLPNLGVDIVFNLCEGRNGRNRESQVPVILEMHQIPYVGSDGLALGITLDKVVAKKCFLADGVPTPRFFVADQGTDLQREAQRIGFPLLVKTRYEGTSKGLCDQSRVEDMASLKRQVAFVQQNYKQSALVEEFISGTEFTVAVLGNDQAAQAMPIVQVIIDGNVDLGDAFYTYERVCSHTVRYACPARITADLTLRLQTIAKQAYLSAGCRDFGRVDFRVDRRGQPYVLEINPLPTLEKSEVFNLFPQVLGTTYEATVNAILDLALMRYGLIPAGARVIDLLRAKEPIMTGSVR